MLADKNKCLYHIGWRWCPQDHFRCELEIEMPYIFYT